MLSKTKTTAVLFSKAKDIKALEAKVSLTIQGTPVQLAPQVKFLGVTYDQRLSWRPHINSVVERTKAPYNVMRNVSAQSWGASKKALLTLYKALVRSRLDYGCEAFYSAPTSQLSRLDNIQHKCLRLCCGAMACTPVNALEQDCGEMPLSIRRTFQKARKIGATIFGQSGVKPVQPRP